jgi:hypothetical protein
LTATANERTVGEQRRSPVGEQRRSPRAMHPPTFSSRRPLATAVLACAAALAAVAALGVTASPAPARARAARIPSCATSGLVIWLNTEANGTLGSIYYKLELTNLSGHPCTLSGYPGVSAVNLAGRQVGRAAAREPFRKPRLVTLASGTRAGGTVAIATLRMVVAGLAPGCRPVLAAGLRVYPPGQTTSKVVPFPFETCSRAYGILDVQAVEPG